MTPAEFAKRRARIEYDAAKSDKWKRRAFNSLVREARAIVVVNSHHVIGWQMLNGQIVCVKQRYKNQETAESYLGMIRECNGGSDIKPKRAYLCRHCGGYHLTSQAE